MSTENKFKRVLSPVSTNTLQDSHTSAIIDLQTKGYMVVVKDINATLFCDRFKIYQNSSPTLKTVVVNNKGKIVALQG